MKNKNIILPKLIVKIICICDICRKLILQNPIKYLRPRNYLYMLLLVYRVRLTLRMQTKWYVVSKVRTKKHIKYRLKESPAHSIDFNILRDVRCKQIPLVSFSLSKNVRCQGSRGSRNFHANETDPNELTTAYLAARPRNRFVRVSDKITVPAYR